jgi:hypothetical protein
VCDKLIVEKILTSFQPIQDGQKSSLLKQLPQFVLEPKIEIQANIVTVRVVIFTKWGGVIQEEYTITRQFPHAVMITIINSLFCR